jgi:hypothetical protein
MAKEKKEKKGEPQEPKAPEIARHSAKQTPRLKERFVKEVASAPPRSCFRGCGGRALKFWPRPNSLQSLPLPSFLLLFLFSLLLQLENGSVE